MDEEIRYPNIETPGEPNENKEAVHKLLKSVADDLTSPFLRMDELHHTKDVEIDRHHRVKGTRVEFSIVYEVEN